MRIVYLEEYNEKILFGEAFLSQTSLKRPVDHVLISCVVYFYLHTIQFI